MNQKTKKIIKIVSISIVGVALAIIFGLYMMFKNEIATINRMEKLDEYPLYYMEYQGDYGFDEFLQVGASSDEELVDYVVKRLLKGLPIEIKVPKLGCSTFTAQTKESENLFGRNFDLTYSPAMMVKTTPKNGYASISMVNLGFLGYGEEKLPDSFISSINALAAPFAPLDGVNEKGLAIGVLLIPSEETKQDNGKVNITTTTAIRMILDKCATVEEAIAMLKEYDMYSSAGSNYHFQISDNSGKSVVVEYINNEMKIVEPSESYQAAANFLLTPGDYDFGYGQDRYEIMIHKLKETQGILSDEEAMQLLSAAAQEPHLNDKGEISGTQWSVVYNQKDLSATVSMGRNYDKTYKFQLDKEQSYDE